MTARARDLIGRTIVAVDFRPFSRGRGRQIAHDPIVTLDNGRHVMFVVEETDTPAYGVRIVIWGRARPKRRGGQP